MFSSPKQTSSGGHLPLFALDLNYIEAPLFT